MPGTHNEMAEPPALWRRCLVWCNSDLAIHTLFGIIAIAQ